MTVLAARAKIFVPKHVWYFYDIEHDEVIMPKEIFGTVSRRKLLKAWTPYLIIAIILLLTRVPQFGLRALLNSIAIHVKNILGVEGLNYDFALIYNPADHCHGSCERHRDGADHARLRPQQLRS